MPDLTNLLVCLSEKIYLFIIKIDIISDIFCAYKEASISKLLLNDND